MKISELKTGDVLLFSPKKGSFTSAAIVKLTGVPLSHAAMFYDECDKTLIEETPPQVSVNKAKKRFSGRMITVRRLKAVKDMEPVIKSAAVYFSKQEPYDKTGLYLVGLLLLFKKWSPNISTQKVITWILKKIIANIDKYINQIKHPGKMPMACSTFVAQCYEDAGTSYELRFTPNNEKNQPGSLLDQVITTQVNIKKKRQAESQIVFNSFQESNNFSAEYLCKNLVEKLNQEPTVQKVKSKSSTKLSQELIGAIAEFGDVHKKLFDFKGSNFDLLKNMENLFVTPGDLLCSCLNLETKGVIFGKGLVAKSRPAKVRKTLPGLTIISNQVFTDTSSIKINQ